MSDKPQNIVHRAFTLNGSLGDHVLPSLYNRQDTHYQLFIGPYIDVNEFLKMNEENKLKKRPK